MGTLTLHIIFITCNENIHTRFHLISKDSTRKCNQLNGPKQSSATPKKQWCISVLIKRKCDIKHSRKQFYFCV